MSSAARATKKYVSPCPSDWEVRIRKGSGLRNELDNKMQAGQSGCSLCSGGKWFQFDATPSNARPVVCIRSSFATLILCHMCVWHGCVTLSSSRVLEHGDLRNTWFVACGVVIERHVRRAPFAAALIGSKEPPVGIETTTVRLRSACSTN